MEGPNGVGVLTSRSRHQMRTGDKSGAAPRRAGVAEVPSSFSLLRPENRHTGSGSTFVELSRVIFSSK